MRRRYNRHDSVTLYSLCTVLTSFFSWWDGYSNVEKSIRLVLGLYGF